MSGLRQVRCLLAPLILQAAARCVCSAPTSVLQLIVGMLYL